MAIDMLGEIVRAVVNRLANGDFDGATTACSISRLTAEDLRQVVHDYGRTFVEPPENAYRNLDAVAVQGSALPTWSVRAPLWSREEGRSDLTLELTIVRDGDRWDVELDDLHVL